MAADVEVFGHVIGGCWHHIDAILSLHLRIDEAPPEGGVVEYLRPGKSGLGLWHDEWGAAHALDPAGDDQIEVASLDGPGSTRQGVQARTAQAICGRATGRDRQARKQGRHPRDVAVIFARLVGAAENHVIQLIPVDTGIARHQGLNRYGGQVVSADVR